MEYTNIILTVITFFLHFIYPVLVTEVAFLTTFGQSGLTNLYNKRVVSSQPVERPLDAFNGGRIGRVGVLGANAAGISTFYSGQRDRAMHSGSLVTTSDGGKWLVHKGKEGKSFDIVVTDAKHMRPNTWQQDVGGQASVSND